MRFRLADIFLKCFTSERASVTLGDEVQERANYAQDIKQEHLKRFV